jgi:hypothetical protein
VRTRDHQENGLIIFDETEKKAETAEKVVTPLSKFSAPIGATNNPKAMINEVSSLLAD